MEVKIPDVLVSDIDTEIAASPKPWRTRREYVLEAISDKLAHDRGYRKRSAGKQNKPCLTPSKD